MSAGRVMTTSGPRGRGTYVHACRDTTFCAEAGGIGNSCGGRTDFTPADPFAFRAGYRGQREHFDVLPEAARYAAVTGGPLEALRGGVYRKVSGFEREQAILALLKEES